jgi:hypothetical protein
MYEVLNDPHAPSYFNAGAHVAFGTIPLEGNKQACFHLQWAEQELEVARTKDVGGRLQETLDDIDNMIRAAWVALFREHDCGG